MYKYKIYYMDKDNRMHTLTFKCDNKWGLINELNGLCEDKVILEIKLVPNNE